MSKLNLFQIKLKNLNIMKKAFALFALVAMVTISTSVSSSFSTKSCADTEIGGGGAGTASRPPMEP